MAYAFSKQAQNSAGGGGQNNIVATFGSNIAAGSCLIAVIYYIHGTASQAIALTGAAGGTWVQVGSEIGNSSDGFMEIWVCLNATGGAAAITATFGAPTTVIFPAIYVAEFTALDTASALTGHAEVRQLNPNAGANPATANAVSTGNMSPPSQPALVFGFSVQVNGTAAPTAESSPNAFTSLTSVWDFGGATSICGRPEHIRVTSTNAIAARFTSPNSDTSNYLNVGVVIAEPAGGGGSQTLTAGMTPTAGLTNLPLQTLTAGVTPGGALTQEPRQTLTAGVTPGGSLNNVTGGAGTQSSGAGVTPTAALAQVPSQALAAGLTPTATLVNEPRHTLTAGVTPTGLLDLLIYLDGGALSAVVTPTATLSNQATVTQGLGAGVTPGATLQNVTGVNLAAGVTPTATLAAVPQQTVTANVTPIAGLTNQAAGVTAHSLDAGVTPTATLTNKPFQALGAEVAPVAQLLGVTGPAGTSGVAGRRSRIIVVIRR